MVEFLMERALTTIKPDELVRLKDYCLPNDERGIDWQFVNHYGRITAVILSAADRVSYVSIQCGGFRASLSQWEILVLKANFQLTNKAVARWLGVQQYTVINHLRTLKETNSWAKSSTKLVVVAEAMGILHPDIPKYLADHILVRRI